MNTWDDDKKTDAAWMVWNKLVHQSVQIGGIGIMSDYAMLAYDQMARGGRWRDPFTAPSISMLESVKDMVTRGIQRGADPAGWAEEFLNWVRFKVPTINQQLDVARNIGRRAGVEGDWIDTYRARRDYRITRSMARRFGKEEGYEVDKFWGGGTSRDSFTTQRNALWEALARGDVAAARDMKRELLKDGMKLQAMKSSVRGRQPIKVGSLSNRAVQRKFLRWVKKRNPAGYERVLQTQKTYELTARKVGLIR